MFMKNQPCRSNNGNNDFASDVIEYINKNYSDVNLNLSRLSEIFGYVPSYISDLFRQKTQMGVIEYVNKKRIESVKILLLTTDMVLSEIASATGFYSEASLIRVFKRHENITPGNYRKINK